MKFNKLGDIFGSVFKKGALKRIKKEILNPEESNAKKALSIGFGVFMGIFPAWGFQMLIAVFLSLVLRLNKVLVLLSTNISFPPLIPLIIYLSYKMGGFWVGKDVVEILWSDQISLEMIHVNLLQYILGALILALFSGLFFGILSYICFFIFRKVKKEEF